MIFPYLSDIRARQENPVPGLNPVVPPRMNEMMREGGQAFVTARRRPGTMKKSNGIPQEGQAMPARGTLSITVGNRNRLFLNLSIWVIFIEVKEFGTDKG